MSQISENHHVVIVEDVCTGSGIREALAWELNHRLKECRIEGIDLGGQFIPHGSMDALYRHCGLDAQSIAATVSEVIGCENQEKT